ncbi:tetratricopeptide repeat protein, partial [bacterium AH-315-F03]|nr:tetratricopeptide repeat protein [bacterium AH-315-F03]
FTVATALDGNYAVAYSGLAECYTIEYDYPHLRTHSVADLKRLANESAEKALELDPDLPEANLSAGAVKGLIDWDFLTAERHLDRAKELNPSYANAFSVLALVQCWMGRFAEALHNIKRAVSLNPLSSVLNRNIAWITYLSRDYQQAASLYKSALEIDPHMAFSHLVSGHTHRMLGDYEEAANHFAAELKVAGGPYNRGKYTLDLSLIALHRGNESEANRLLEEGRSYTEEDAPGDVHLAYAFCAFGMIEEAIELVSASVQRKDPIFLGMSPDAGFDVLRSLPKYKLLMEQIGLADSPIMQYTATGSA